MALLPFGVLPGHWGLKGKTRLRAKAEYELSGKELEYKLAEIDFDGDGKAIQIAKLKIDLKHNDITKKEYEIRICEVEHDDDLKAIQIAKLKISLKYNDITKKEYDHTIAELEFEGDEESIIEAKLKSDLKRGDISKFEFDKGMATLKNQPWFEIVNGKIVKDPKTNKNKMVLQLDWNELWIKERKEEGWTGVHDYEIADKWIQDFCYQLGHDEYFNGEGDIDTESFVVDARPLVGKRKTNRENLGGNITSYS